MHANATILFIRFLEKLLTGFSVKLLFSSLTTLISFQDNKTMAPFRLSKDELAWNVDGSASDKIEGLSWIQFWRTESGTPHPVRCSFVGCMSPAEVGGHIWIRGRGGAFIAPICKSCNYSENSNRMQGSDSKLKHHTVVVAVEMTEDMRNATRRIAVEARSCDECGRDISNCPSHHTACLRCFNRDRRPCQECGVDISDRPSNHKVCYACYSRPSEACRKRKGRGCCGCGRDISTRPSNYTLCYRCYSDDGSASSASDGYY